MPNFTPTYEIKVCFVSTKEFTKKGKPKKRRIVHRKMILDGFDSVFKIEKFSVVAFARGGETKFSVKYLKPIEKSRHLCQLNTYHEDVWVKEGTYNHEEILKWLKWRIENPSLVLDELLNMEPEAREDSEE